MERRLLELVRPLADGATADVPCNGCTACCRNPLRFLIPGLDDVESYEVEWFDDPVIGKRPRLANRADGSCVYLTDGGCSIHERAPRICRSFDCRKFFAAHTRAERRRMVASGALAPDVLEAGRARLPTLVRK